MTNDEVRIWRHGKNPGDETLYYICDRCGCIYSTAKKNCKYRESECRGYGGHYILECPECNAINSGMNERDYKRRMGLKA